MNGLYFIITIIGREQSDAYSDYFHENGVDCSFAGLCHGTARQKMLDFLGIEQRERVMLQAICAQPLKDKLMQGFVRDMGISLVGNGIGISIPIDSIGEESGINYLMEGQSERCCEVNELNDERISENMEYALVIAITRGGYAETVMDAARRADVKGATVVHAKGIGDDFSAKFFGISIASEVELVYIVTRQRDKERIVKAISKYAGMETPANTAVLTLPVEDVVGLKSVIE